MTIGDALMPVGCDEDGCSEEILVEMDIESVPGPQGVTRFDHNESSIELTLVNMGEGWTVNENGEDGHRHFCEACSDARAERPAYEEIVHTWSDAELDRLGPSLRESVLRTRDDKRAASDG